MGVPKDIPVDDFIERYLVEDTNKNIDLQIDKKLVSVASNYESKRGLDFLPIDKLQIQIDGDEDRKRIIE